MRWLLKTCPLISLALAAAVLLAFAPAWWSLFVAVVLLACPVSALWAAWTGRGPLPVPLDEPIPVTRGITMDYAVPVYDVLCRVIGLGAAFRKRTLELAGVRPGEHMLDVGCGTGVLTRLAAETVGPAGAATGIDPGPDMIRMARQNAAATASAARFHLAAVESLPFADAGFDVVLSSLMLHHLPADVRRQGLAEIRRVLKPGGRLLAVDIDRPENRLWWLVIWPMRMMPTVDCNLRGEVPAELRAAGFAPVEVLGHWRGLLGFWRAHRPADENKQQRHT